MKTKKQPAAIPAGEIPACDQTQPQTPLGPPTFVETPWLEPAMLPLAKIKPSLTQPRKKFNPEKQLEMEASMKEHGFTLSTLLVRPSPDSYFIREHTGGGLFDLVRVCKGEEFPEATYGTQKEARLNLSKVDGCFELVAGERRFRGANSVGIKEAPCIIRQLSDQQVLEIQLIENMQRDDLTPIEEAEGLQRLLALRDEAGRPVHTFATLAVKIGKSSRHLERRVKLAMLTGEAREAVEAGQLSPKTALVIARIPDEKMREKATKEILHPQYEEGPLSLRKAEALVQQRYMCDLREAPFKQDDAGLLPVETGEVGERSAGGACSDCPHKLANSSLVEDLPAALHNMCLNPVCFERKKEAGWRKWQAAETDPAKNRRALSEAECDEIYSHGEQLSWNCGMVDLKDFPDSGDLKPGETAPGPWKELIKGKEVEILVVRDHNGKKHELIQRQLALQAADENKHKIFKTLKAEDFQTGGRMTLVEQIAATRARSDEEELDDVLTTNLAAAVFTKASNGKPMPDGFYFDVICVIEREADNDNLMIVEMRRGWPSGSLLEQVKPMESHHQLGILAEIMAVLAGPDEEKNYAKMFGLDMKEATKKSKAEVKAVQKTRVALFAEIDPLIEAADLKRKDLDAMAKEVMNDEEAYFNHVRLPDHLISIKMMIEKKLAPKAGEIIDWRVFVVFGERVMLLDRLDEAGRVVCADPFSPDGVNEMTLEKSGRGDAKKVDPAFVLAEYKRLKMTAPRNYIDRCKPRSIKAAMSDLVYVPAEELVAEREEAAGRALTPEARDKIAAAAKKRWAKAKKGKVEKAPDEIVYLPFGWLTEEEQNQVREFYKESDHEIGKSEYCMKGETGIMRKLTPVAACAEAPPPKVKPAPVDPAYLVWLKWEDILPGDKSDAVSKYDCPLLEMMQYDYAFINREVGYVRRPIAATLPWAELESIVQNDVREIYEEEDENLSLYAFAWSETDGRYVRQLLPTAGEAEGVTV